MYGHDKYSRKYKHTIAYQITADLGNYMLLVMTHIRCCMILRENFNFGNFLNYVLIEFP